MPDKQLLIHKNWVSYSLLALLFIIGIIARTAVINFTNIDTSNYLIPWYDYISNKGIATALGDNFANYTPLYTYLLALMTAMPIPKLIAIKLIPITMDIVNAFMIYKIVKHKYPQGLVALWASAIFWCLPTVVLNSAFWGQADSLYAGFLLMTLYFLIVNRPFLAVLLFSVSISIKLQAIFMGPVLAIIVLGSAFKHSAFKYATKIKVWYFMLIPIVYSMLCLPAVILGRQWLDVWTIYAAQADTFKWLSAYAANPYVFIPNQYFDPVSKFGLIFATACMLTWIVFTVIREVKFSKDRLMLVALTTVALAPYLLPQMHERYFYAADLISLIVAFYLPRLWFLPLMFQITSSLAYYPVLSEKMAHTPVKYAAIINTVLIAYILWNQFFNKTK